MLQDQIMVLTQTLSTVTQFINNFSGYISNTTACTLQDPLCDFCLNADTCKICKQVRRIGDLSIRRNFSLIAGRVCLICRAISPLKRLTQQHTDPASYCLGTGCSHTPGQDVMHWSQRPALPVCRIIYYRDMHSWDSKTGLALSKCVN